MRRPRFTIAGLLIAVAIAALNCFWIVNFDFVPGVLLLGLALNVGYFCLRRARDGRRRFWIGFEATGLAVLLVCLEADPVMAVYPRAAVIFLKLALVFLHPNVVQSLEDFVYFENSNPLVAQFVVFEGAFGLPMLLLALGGGFLATSWRRSPRPDAEGPGPLAIGATGG